MTEKCEVYLWGTKVGVLYQKKNCPYVSFEYDKDFLNQGLEISPLNLPLKEGVYNFPALANSSFLGLPGIFRDSLPDSFGKTVIESYLTQQGIDLSNFTTIDSLCLIGKRGMGALEYIPSLFTPKENALSLSIEELVTQASIMLANRKHNSNQNENFSYDALLQTCCMLGGARAKALVYLNEKTNEVTLVQQEANKDNEYWLMKFDNVSSNGDHGLVDKPQYTLIEYAYYKMALISGINMSECRIYESNGCSHFMTKRFDRENGQKLHIQSLGALAHISYNEPCLCSYELASFYMQQLNLRQEEIDQFYRRMVFNVLSVNQDDHVKNISFIMNKKGIWSLSPAYDITFSYDRDNKWLKAHQMTINNKSSNITLDDLLIAGSKMGIKKSNCMNIIKEVTEVVSNFSYYAKDVGIKDSTIKYIESIIKENKVL